VTPNNPTGMMLNEEKIRHVSENTPENVLLFMDEVDHEFAIHAGGPNALEILKGRKGPWVVPAPSPKHTPGLAFVSVMQSGVQPKWLMRSVWLQLRLILTDLLKQPPSRCGSGESHA